MLGKKYKPIALLLLPLALYLGLYTFNRKTNFLDRLATITGLEAVGWIVYPGQWIQRTGQGLWQDYIALLDVRRENEQLRQRIQDLKIRAMRLRSRADEAERLRELLSFSPPPDWSCTGSRIVGEQISPSDVLETVTLNKGHSDLVRPDMPALTPAGLVGKILKTSPHFSKLVLLTDPNSRIPVISSNHRSKAILKGRGADAALSLEYVARNSPLSEGEIVVTSGLGGIFPKGIPVARITQIEQTSHSLFQEVEARPLVNLRELEEVLLLRQSRKHKPEGLALDHSSLLRLD
ncbi:MAG: rod shape-determining protein MreC [Desulfohalobiaceae bacterium]|nr:rod shape-determining protein MreC [Desulfohalobiaceae bacterium]